MIELIRTAYATLKDRKGVTAMEYAVIAAGIVVVVAIAADALGGSIGEFFNKFAEYLQGKPSGLPGSSS
jgi:pilus assembly protein Flp/PilA